MVLLFFSCCCFLLAQTAYGSTTGCTNGTPVSDGSGGYFAQISCTLYWQSGAYPLSLEPYFNVPSVDIPENYLGAGYIIFSSDSTDVTNQTLTNPAAFQDILFFDNNVAAGTASDEVQLYWSATGFPSVSTIENFNGGGDYEVLAYTGSPQLFSNGPNVDFTVEETTVVPEPSSLILLGTGLLGIAGAVRRRLLR